LLELLIVLAISTLLISNLMLAMNYLQLLSHDISLRCDRDRNLWIAPLLLVQWVAGAGNQHWNQKWNGVEIAGSVAHFRSDMEGPSGFPDSQLSDSYEDIALDQRGDSLAMKSGLGFFQPVLQRILSFETERLRDDLILLKWSGRTDHPLKTSGTVEAQSVVMKVHLWNYRENLFEE
jgi:hypothetical protein